MNDITLFQYQKHEVRIVKAENGDPLWVAQDVCKILGLKEVDVALRKLDEDEKLIRTLYGSGQKREFLFVTESGLYNLLFRSRTKKAVLFRRWICHEVVPQIRRTGFYGTKPLMGFPQRYKAFRDAFKMAKLYDIKESERYDFAAELADNHYYDDNKTLKEWISEWKLQSLLGKERYQDYQKLLEAGKKIQEQRNNIRLIRNEDKS